MFGVGFPRRYAPVCQGGPMGIEAVEFGVGQRPVAPRGWRLMIRGPA